MKPGASPPRLTWLSIVACIVLLSSACFGATRERVTILVDFSHDEFASEFFRYFPGRVVVRPGTELVFRQTWTGEPHTVTGGTLVDAVMEALRPYRDKFLRGKPLPDEPPANIDELEAPLVSSYADFSLNQTAAQPCYLDHGAPRKDGKPCRNQEQPEFDGNQSFYNSGLIPYEGPQANEHRVKLADDIAPGSYWFYCNMHGEFQSTEVVVNPSEANVDTLAEINRRARSEIDALATPLLSLFEEAESHSRVTLHPPGVGATTVRGRFAGIAAPDRVDSAVNEFIPKQIAVKAGEKITWNLMGQHTISFGVPRYFPIYTFDKDGTVTRNRRLDPPAGTARPFEETDRDEAELHPELGGVVFDGGSFDGRGFWSSGVVSGDPYVEYSMRITETGSYRYACLIHPTMVGTVDVT